VNDNIEALNAFNDAVVDNILELNAFKLAVAASNELLIYFTLVSNEAEFIYFLLQNSPQSSFVFFVSILWFFRLSEHEQLKYRTTYIFVAEPKNIAIILNKF
jgi:hypothetical protein